MFSGPVVLPSAPQLVMVVLLTVCWNTSALSPDGGGISVDMTQVFGALGPGRWRALSALPSPPLMMARANCRPPPVAETKPSPSISARAPARTTAVARTVPAPPICPCAVVIFAAAARSVPTPLIWAKFATVGIASKPRVNGPRFAALGTATGVHTEPASN